MRRTIGTAFVNAAVLALAGLVYLLLLSPASVMTVSGSRAFPVYYGGGEGAALLIPVSWDAASLGPILDELSENGAHAAFAVTEEWAKDFPETLRRIAKEGHELAAICGPAEGRSLDETIAQTRAALDTIEGISGLRPRFLYSASRSGSAAAAGNALGLISIAGTVDLDSGRGTAFEIAERVAGLKDGSIVVAEPTEGFARALPIMLEKLKKLGISIVSLHKMLYN